ncbi:unnamed protein product [Adineta ricciae]|nr:unnamed protein product [Adineta ricciae]
MNIIEKKLEFRPECVKTTNINDLQACHANRMYTVEKIKKTALVCDSTGALRLTLWENQFEQIDDNMNPWKADKGQMLFVDQLVINTNVTVVAEQILPKTKLQYRAMTVDLDY